MTSQRIQPVNPPYDESVQKDFDIIMPTGVPPLNIFRTMANNPRVLHRMIVGGLLDKGSISIQEREIIILRFDDKGILAAVETRSAEDGKDVLPVDRKTPTAGNEINFFEQIFGNLGRFNK